MVFSYFQPTKNISIKMKDPTNTGMTRLRPLDNFKELDGDLRFQAITLGEDGLGKVATAKDAFVGVLIESFNKPGIETQVMYSGIVPMLVAEGESITAGCFVQVHEPAGQEQQKPGIQKYPETPQPVEGQPTTKIIGIALKASPNHAGDVARIVPVLIGKY